MTVMVWILLGLALGVVVLYVIAQHYYEKAKTAESDLADAKKSLVAMNEKAIADAAVYRAEADKLERVISDKNAAVLQCRNDFVTAVANLPPHEAVAVVAPYFDRVLAAGGALRRQTSPDEVLTDPATPHSKSASDQGRVP